MVEVVWNAFESVRPYVADAQTLKDMLEDLAKKFKDVDEIINEIEKKSQNFDETRKTDFRILINEIKKIRLV
ncbi:MAG: hypothetical protein ACE5K4_01600 [Candidatus Hydrothermarchaeota archaeon]